MLQLIDLTSWAAGVTRWALERWRRGGGAEEGGWNGRGRRKAVAMTLMQRGINSNMRFSCIFMLICLSIYLCVCLSVYLSVYFSIHPSIYSLICLSLYLPIRLFLYLSIYLYIFISIYLYVYLSICPSIYIAVCLSDFLSLPPFFLSICSYMHVCVDICEWPCNVYIHFSFYYILFIFFRISWFCATIPSLIYIFPPKDRKKIRSHYPTPCSHYIRFAEWSLLTEFLRISRLCHRSPSLYYLNLIPLFIGDSVLHRLACKSLREMEIKYVTWYFFRQERNGFIILSGFLILNIDFDKRR